MNDLRTLSGERSVLRWGGLAGILGSALFMLVFVIVGVFVRAAAAEPGTALTKFPEIRTARIAENVLYLAVLILWVGHFLALYRALRTIPAPALFGSVLGVVGLTLLAAGALPHVAIIPISDLYHAPAATPDDQATLMLIWRGSQAILDAMLFAGLAVLPVGVIALGVAMIGTPTFGAPLGRFALGIGVIGIVAAAVTVIDPGSGMAALGTVGLIAFHLVLGWKTHALSRGGPLLEDAAAGARNAGAPRVALGER